MKTIVKLILAAGAYGLIPSIIYSDIKISLCMMLAMLIFSIVAAIFVPLSSLTIKLIENITTKIFE